MRISRMSASPQSKSGVMRRHICKTPGGVSETTNSCAEGGGRCGGRGGDSEPLSSRNLLGSPGRPLGRVSRQMSATMPGYPDSETDRIGSCGGTPPPLPRSHGAGRGSTHLFADQAIPVGLEIQYSTGAGRRKVDATSVHPWMKGGYGVHSLPRIA